MEEKELQIFEIDPSFKKITVIGSWISLFFPILFIALPFLPDDNPPKNPNGMYIFSTIGAALFTVISWHLFRLKRILPDCSVSIDSDGIWSTHKKKERSLVKWQQISNIVERPILQRLDVIVRDGTPVLRIEYQLSNFDRLRSLLLERINIRQYQCLPISFSKTTKYHLFYLFCMICFTSLGWYVGQQKPLFGYGGTAFILVMICYEYFVTACSLKLDHHGLTIKYPVSSRNIRYKDIVSIKLADTFVKGARHPEVLVLFNNIKKPLKLKGLGIDAVHLYKTLKMTIEKKGFSSNKANAADAKSSAAD